MRINKLISRNTLRQMGPGLITGAADDDPSGIATYSQAGAQAGFGLLWTMLFTFPLMVGIQAISARIGRVTGGGLAANMRAVFSTQVCYLIVGLLVVANTINIAADIAVMGEALQLLVGGGEHGHALLFGLVSLLLQVFMPYRRYVHVLKWLTVSLFSYVAVVLTLHVPWGQVITHTLFPTIEFSSHYITLLVAVLGTTISPYLFFWQASQEVEEMRVNNAVPLLYATEAEAARQLRRIKYDTTIGMGFSNLIAFFIILSTALTLHVAGITTIESASQAAEALRPIAGDLTFWLFSLGIIGTGMLAVPVLAGSAAYAVANVLNWRHGLDRKLVEAKRFYAIIALATLGGTFLDFTQINPLKALLWSAVLNGIISVPIMIIIIYMATRPMIMGGYVLNPGLRALGGFATVIMFIAVVTMFYLWLA